MSTIITRQDCISQLPDGSDPLVVALHLSETAPQRHASRVAAVRAAAAEHLRGLGAEPTDQLVATLCAVEVGGTGGRGGYAGDATRRMSWAGALGKGRKQASDGAAWDAAIRDVAASTAPSDVEALLVAVDDGPDLEWPLAFALRRAYEARDDRELAARWSGVARQAAALADPDDGAGRLAGRYGLPTMGRDHRIETILRDEIVAALVGVPEAELRSDLYRAGEIWIDCRATHTTLPGSDEPVTAREVNLSTRVLDDAAVDAFVLRAWHIREVVDYDLIVSIHAALLGRERDDADLERRRDRWDAPTGRNDTASL